MDNRIDRNSSRICFCTEPLYGYRINQETITQLTSIVRLDHRAISYFNRIEHLLNKTSSARQDKVFCKALLKEAYRENRYFLGLMRKSYRLLKYELNWQKNLQH
ncbi:hypothetical protein [Candidatus Williamhamiltonella defendens]|uniref:hypothetical protein n=1 Tax=Candidatus Williamhamiltonella defendens TaxID=138072 RepID=UPI00130DA6F3|nr:hypothetical protein [Candidatus Hamiltonella defensa]